MPTITYNKGDLVHATAWNDRSDRSPKYPAIVLDDDKLMILSLDQDKPSSTKVLRKDYHLFPMSEEAIRHLTFELKLVADAALTALGLPSPYKAES